MLPYCRSIKSYSLGIGSPYLKTLSVILIAVKAENYWPRGRYDHKKVDEIKKVDVKKCEEYVGDEKSLWGWDYLGLRNI